MKITMDIEEEEIKTALLEYVKDRYGIILNFGSIVLASSEKGISAVATINRESKEHY